MRQLRLSIKGPNGNPLSQTEFGRLIGKSLNTIQRYESLVAPKGAALIDLRELAKEHGQGYLAQVFDEAATSEIGQSVRSSRIAADRIKAAMDKLDDLAEQYPHLAPVVDVIVADLTVALNRMFEINPPKDPEP